MKIYGIFLFPKKITMEEKKKTWDDIQKELEDAPGGLTCVISGVVIAFLIGILSSISIFLGIFALAVIGLLVFLYASGLKFPKELLTILCSTLAALPVVLCLYFLLWALAVLISKIILLFL